MVDSSLITNLGVSGFALYILWMSYKEFMRRMKEKDQEQAAERADFARRMDIKEEGMRKLEFDVRTSLTETLSNFIPLRK